MVNQSLVFQIKFWGKNPALSVGAKLYKARATTPVAALLWLARFGKKSTLHQDGLYALNFLKYIHVLLNISDEQ
ncbi:MAG: hypothetical protein ACK4K0_04385 [Flavobacteriales bacterium]